MAAGERAVPGVTATRDALNRDGRECRGALPHLRAAGSSRSTAAFPVRRAAAKPPSAGLTGAALFGLRFPADRRHGHRTRIDLMPAGDRAGTNADRADLH